MLNNSKLGDAVYDPFLGSGTSLIAAETEGRRCFGMELNPAYVDIIVRRWQDFTGREATLGATGQTYGAVAAARMAETGIAA
jgi:DNA modification methylase